MKKIGIMLLCLKVFSMSYIATAQNIPEDFVPPPLEGKQPKLTVTYVNDGEGESVQNEQNLPPIKDIKFVKNDIGKPPHKMPRRKFDWAKRLKMDEWQQQKLAEIEKQSAEKFQNIRQKMTELRQQEEQIRREDEQKIRQILNEKQQKKFDKIISRLHRPRK